LEPIEKELEEGLLDQMHIEFHDWVFLLMLPSESTTISNTNDKLYIGVSGDTDVMNKLLALIDKKWGHWIKD